MDILLNILEDKKINEELTISGSKSESNRLLILQKLFPEISIENLSDSDFEILCGAQPIVKPYFLSGIKGVPSDSKFTTGCVLFILKNSETAYDALRKSIWLGGDVDSVASITTGILAGKNGLQSIPKFMIEQVEGVPYLQQIAKAFEKI